MFRYSIALLLASVAFSVSGAPAPEIPGWVSIEASAFTPAPAWALLQRQLIEEMDRAGGEFYRTYVQADGTLRWKERYEGGMNSSDDAYEGFRGFSLHYILGGSQRLDQLHRHVWEGITRQFSRYGQIYREFDANWDWMHHGEGYVSFYPLGMADPQDEKFRDRSIRFAAMYIGEDPEAPNYDPRHNIIRASMNGSRGPKLEWTKRDWIPTNANLVYYHLPFDDIPGVDSPTGWINDHPENDQFARIVKVMSERMARGDVPINLTVAPLVANAYLYTGEQKYKQWILKYLQGWIDRTRANDGITPDNVGLSGTIGEHNGGRWWGGYYGWKWVRGGTDIVLAALTAGKVAQLLTGDTRWLDLSRSQLELMRSRSRLQDGQRLIPIRYDDRNGWHHHVREDPYAQVILWAMSQSPQDWREVERLAQENGLRDPDLGWAMFVQGRNESFPVEAFQSDLRFIAQKMQHILHEHGDPETWYDAKWLALEPMPTDNLVRLTLGGTPVHKRGEMLHSRLRYFDAGRRRPGLPQDVAALVTGMGWGWVEAELVNTNVLEPRQVLVQGGAYGEDTVRRIRWQEGELRRQVDVDSPYFEVRMKPGAGIRLRIETGRYQNQPKYGFPWDQHEP